MSLMDNFYELVFARVFAGGHIGEQIDFAVALHDSESRESVAREAKVFFASQNYIT